MLKTKFTKSLLILLIILGFASCTTYYIPVESFKAQFKGIDSTNLRLVHTQVPAGYVVDYYANPIDYIKCVDKKNNPIELKNSPSIEIRFTDNNNKRTVYYFDKVLLQDTLIIGDMSRFLKIRKGISINNIKLIEVQDGKKDFHYVNKK